MLDSLAGTSSGRQAPHPLYLSGSAAPLGPTPALTPSMIPPLHYTPASSPPDFPLPAHRNTALLTTLLGTGGMVPGQLATSWDSAHSELEMA